MKKSWWIFGLLVLIIIAGGILMMSGQKEQDTGWLSLLTPMATPTPELISGPAIVHQIQQVSRLETTVYSVERVIEASQSDPVWPDWLRGDRLLLIAYGQVVAGVDLGKMTNDDVVVAEDGRTVTITLPAAEIFSVDLDNAKTQVYDRQRGVFAPPNTNLESEARLAAENEILAAACDDGILGRATVDAQRAMEQFMGLFDFRTVINASPVPACGGQE
ncbi:MAG: DUF4230 domain-containing protein [Anaerolineales bacterium]|nr:DUF4230 domain-containing protein [Anaerolineales bacterium]